MNLQRSCKCFFVYVFAIYWLAQRTTCLVQHVENGAKCGATASLIGRSREASRGRRVGAIHSSHCIQTSAHAAPCSIYGIGERKTRATLAPSRSHLVRNYAFLLTLLPYPPPLSASRFRCTSLLRFPLRYRRLSSALRVRFHPSQCSFARLQGTPRDDADARGRNERLRTTL